MSRAAVVVALAIAAPLAHAEPSTLYDRYCLACHGAAGDGRGPAAPWLSPAPRDFTAGRYKWRSTPSGRAPTDADLARVVRDGAPGTTMPGFAGILSDAQIAALVAEIKGFAPARFAAKPAEPAPLPPEPALLSDGRARFTTLGCASCHGAAGKGDGASAADLAPRPFDLTTSPLRRGASRRDIALTIVTGLDGTAMPALPGLPAADLWGLAAYVDSIRARGAPPMPGPIDPAAKTPSAGLHLAPQGTPPPSLPPVAASLSAEQCARCHAKQHREWRRSIHAAAVSPGLVGQLVTFDAATTTSCLTCHAPLDEQRAAGPLRHEAISCAGCHVRNHVRHGPPRRADASLLGIPTYPLVVDATYERADLCLPCHQLGADAALAGRPLLDTYREWLTGPYMRRGVQCQHCHMPDREHTFRGVHDPDTVRQGLRVSAARRGASIEIVAANVGAGHYLPTTPTPAIRITVEPMDENGRALPTVEKRIGRHITFDGRSFHEVADTRIPPGGEQRFTVDAARARVRVTVAPDDYYETFYAQLLARSQPPEARRELQAAARRAGSSRYVLYDLTVE